MAYFISYTAHSPGSLEDNIELHGEFHSFLILLGHCMEFICCNPSLVRIPDQFLTAQPQHKQWIETVAGIGTSCIHFPTAQHFFFSLFLSSLLLLLTDPNLSQQDIDKTVGIRCLSISLISRKVAVVQSRLKAFVRSSWAVCSCSFDKRFVYVGYSDGHETHFL